MHAHTWRISKPLFFAGLPKLGRSFANLPKNTIPGSADPPGSLPLNPMAQPIMPKIEIAEEEIQRRQTLFKSGTSPELNRSWWAKYLSQEIYNKRVERMLLMSKTMQQYQYLKGGRHVNRIVAGTIDVGISGLTLAQGLLNVIAEFYELLKALKNYRKVGFQKLITVLASVFHQSFRAAYLTTSAAVYAFQGVALITVGLLLGVAELSEIVYLTLNNIHSLLKYVLVVWFLYWLWTWSFKFLKSEYIRTFEMRKTRLEDEALEMAKYEASVEIIRDDSTEPGMIVRLDPTERQNTKPDSSKSQQEKDFHQVRERVVRSIKSNRLIAPKLIDDDDDEDNSLTEGDEPEIFLYAHEEGIAPDQKDTPEHEDIVLENTKVLIP